MSTLNAWDSDTPLEDGWERLQRDLDAARAHRWNVIRFCVVWTLILAYAVAMIVAAGVVIWTSVQVIAG